jgi:hypothetical protein
MNRRVAFPFLTLSESAVDATAWVLHLNGVEARIDGDFLADWDYSSSIRVSRTVRLDRKIASVDLGIPEDELMLAVVTTIGTGPGRLPRLVLKSECLQVPADGAEVEIEVEIDGERLSSVLDLANEVVLASPSRERNVLSPFKGGHRLWQDRIRVRLEGEEPRFPMEITDLRALVGESTSGAAPWYLYWSPRDWFRDFHGALRLYLHSESQEFIRRVEEEDVLLLQAIMADVMGQVCERLVADPEADELLDACDPGSLGAQAAAWLKLAWPQHDLGFIRSILENRPGEFRAAFLALAEQGES